MKDAEYAETNEGLFLFTDMPNHPPPLRKSRSKLLRNVLKLMKNQFSDFYFSSHVHFCTEDMVNFRLIFTKTRKIEIGKIGKLIFH